MLRHVQIYFSTSKNNKKQRENYQGAMTMEVLGNNSKEMLKTIVERIESLEEDKTVIAMDIKDVYERAKSEGFDVKTLREIIKLRKKSVDKREEMEALLDVYKHALGMTQGELDL